MTITASRITEGTARDDDMDIVCELDRRYDYAIQRSGYRNHAERTIVIDRARHAYLAASKAYHAKWTAGAPAAVRYVGSEVRS